MSALHHAEHAVRRCLRNQVEFAFPSLISTGVVLASFLLVGVFGLILLNLSSVMDRWGRDVQVYAYFADGVGEESCFRVKEEIEIHEEVAHIHYVSPEEALETFRRLIPEADVLLADLDRNPLPASLEIRLQSDIREPAQVAAFASRIDRPEFLEIDYAGEWVSRFYTFLNLLKLSAVAMGTLLGLACIVIVANTIQLTIWARREEIEVLRLVGASNRFIEAPFLLEGVMQGLLGSALSLGLLWALYHFVFVGMQESLGLIAGTRMLSFLPPPVVALFLLAGICLGLLGSWLSVTRILDRLR